MTGKDDVFNAQEAADFLGAHVETVRRLARRGEIPAFKVGKDWRFRRETLLQWESSHHQRTHSATVLVVDDEESVHRLIRRILESEGYTAFTATRGEDGLAYVSEQEIDLILLDLKMPGMTGPKFLLELRKTHANIPVIIITGYSNSKLMTEAMEATGDGPVMLLSKPFSQKQLINSVRMVLKGAFQNE